MGILQVRILEWVANPFSRESSQPKDQTQVSCSAGREDSSLAGKPIYLKLDTNSTQQATHWVTGGSGLVTKLCPTLATPQTVAHQALLSQGIPRQEYWSGLPFPSLGNLPNPGLQCCRQSPALQANSLPTELLEKPHWETTMYLMHIVGWVL